MMDDTPDIQPTLIIVPSLAGYAVPFVQPRISAERRSPASRHLPRASQPSTDDVLFPLASSRSPSFIIRRHLSDGGRPTLLSARCPAPGRDWRIRWRGEVAISVVLRAVIVMDVCQQLRLVCTTGGAGTSRDRCRHIHACPTR